MFGIIRKNIILFIAFVIYSLSLEQNLYSMYTYYFISALAFFLLVVFLIMEKKWFSIKHYYWFFVIGLSLSCIFFSTIHMDIISLIKGILIFIVFYIAYCFYRIKVNILAQFILATFFIGIISYIIQVNGTFIFWETRFLRNGSIYFDPNYASSIFATSAILSLILINNNIYRWCVSIFFAIALFFTYSKGGILSFLIGMACFFYVKYGYKSIVYIVVFSLALMFLYNSSILNLDLFRFNQGFNSRDDFFYITMSYVFEDSNLFGNEMYNIKNLLNSRGFDNSSTHNYYLDLLLSNGIFPFFFMLTLIFISIIKGIIYRNKYFPIFMMLLVNSNVLSISVGGIGILSFIFTYSIVEILNSREIDL
ncbi:hypothetical protein Q7460_02425 [Glaesserella parasuis]|nr:hypothetical protein [Glaesserella parasuis]MDP0114990.1 hypothetical protein [Glaesserella parasuis]